MINKVIQGDCLEVMRGMLDNSVDAIVTDPPYGLSFMGKKWDYDVPSQEIWGECLRVLKPGGYLLAFAGTRTQHRMAVRIEDAGFEIRDMIAWVYGSGFPKSLNVGKSVNQLETNEWSKISKALDNIDQKSIMEVWKSNAKPAGIQLSKSLTEVGSNTPKNFFVPDIAVLYHKAEVPVAYAPVFIAELSSKGLTPLSEESGIIVQENADTNTILLQNRAKFAVKLSQSHEVKPFSIFTAQCDVKEWLNENTEVNHKVDEALKTLRGNKKYSNEEITNVLCVALTDILKLTILNQSKTFQSYDTKGKMDYASAINVIITEYTAENLISNTVAILKSKAVDKLQGNERRFIAEEKTQPKFKYSGSGQLQEKWIDKDTKTITKGTSEWEGWGTALKPALEPITVARKPISEKTVAENCLKWGTGGINIDESRIPTDDNRNREQKDGPLPSKYGFNTNSMGNKFVELSILGRFPANLIHDGSDEVVSLFPNSKGASSQNNFSNGKIYRGQSLLESESKLEGYREWYNDNGSAARFFYCAKTSKAERNRGCEGLEEKKISDMPDITMKIYANKEEREISSKLFTKYLTRTDKEIADSYGFSPALIRMWRTGDRIPNIETYYKLKEEYNIPDDIDYLYEIEQGERTSIIDSPKRTSKNNHPTVKPIALMEYLVKLVSREGAIILDPFAGSGSTLIACKNLGRNWIGIETDSSYCEIASKRIAGYN